MFHGARRHEPLFSGLSSNLMGVQGWNHNRQKNPTRNISGLWRIIEKSLTNDPVTTKNEVA